MVQDTDELEPAETAGQFALFNNKALLPLQDEPVKHIVKKLMVQPIMQHEATRMITLEDATMIAGYGPWAKCKDDFMRDRVGDSHLFVSNKLRV